MYKELVEESHSSFALEHTIEILSNLVCTRLDCGCILNSKNTELYVYQIDGIDLA